MVTATKKNKSPRPENVNQADGETGEGAGGGGGMYAKPIGVYEITPATTKFIPVTGSKRLLIAIAIGFLVRGWLHSKRRNKKNS